MKRIVSILLICLSGLPAFAQADTSFHLLLEMKGDIVNFTVDNLDNIYVLNSRNQVKKYNANGDSVAIYNDIRRFGRAASMDASNPLKVLLYYKDFATVIMLDRLLNPVNIVDLRKSNILQARAVAQSYDNKIWVFDEIENKFKKIGEDGKLLQETPDLRLVLDQQIQPVKIADENQYVYLYDPANGVYVFDYYGSLKNVIQIRGWHDLKVSGGYIFGTTADSIYRYDIRSFMYDEWKKPAAMQQALSVDFSSTRLYALRKESETQTVLSVYTLRR